MDILKKLLEGGIPFDRKFVLIGNNSDYLEQNKIIDKFISVTKSDSSRDLATLVNLLKKRDSTTPMFKFDSCSNIYHAGQLHDFPYAQESVDLGPKAEFKKTPIESLKKKKAAKTISLSPLMKSLMEKIER